MWAGSATTLGWHWAPAQAGTGHCGHQYRQELSVRRGRHQKSAGAGTWHGHGVTLVPVWAPVQADTGHQNGLALDTSLVGQYGLALDTTIGWHWAPVQAGSGQWGGLILGTSLGRNLAPAQAGTGYQQGQGHCPSPQGPALPHRAGTCSGHSRGEREERGTGTPPGSAPPPPQPSQGRRVQLIRG